MTMTRNRRRDLTIEEARALADKWDAMGESHREAQQIASRFSDAGPHRVIERWETGRVIEDPKRPRSRNRQRLSKFEIQALGERWAELFGRPPPVMGNGAPSGQPAAPAPTASVLADDRKLGPKLSMKDLRDVTGLSPSTIKRKVRDKTFPASIKVSTRRVVWDAGKVREWLAKREAGEGVSKVERAPLC
jgi:predicted DNA-binding transcriptional regulator AlpA